MTESKTVACPFCEAEIGVGAKKCRHCGEWVSRRCQGCGTPLRGEWAARGWCTECQARPYAPVVAQVPDAVAFRKSRGAATLFALLFGGIGVHKFYLGKPGRGLAYLIFCWTLIPALFALFEGISYAVMGEAEFHRRYSG